MTILARVGYDSWCDLRCQEALLRPLRRRLLPLRPLLAPRPQALHPRAPQRPCRVDPFAPACAAEVDLMLSRRRRRRRGEPQQDAHHVRQRRTSAAPPSGASSWRAASTLGAASRRCCSSTTFRRFDDFFDRIIEEHIQKRRKRRGGATAEEAEMDLVDVMLDVQENTKDTEMPLTMDNVKAVILDMFPAGTDMIFTTLDWAMSELLINPSAMSRAQAEIRTIVGGDHRKLAEEADLPRMPYLKAVIKAVFRPHPVAPLLVPRESMESVTIEGYEIPAKTRVFVNALAIGRDPDAFKWERFLNSSVDFKGQDFELIPFGAGRRGCPAIAFGTSGVEIALDQLLHSFEWELPAGVKAEDLDMDEVIGIRMHRTERLVAVATPYLPTQVDMTPLQLK